MREASTVPNKYNTRKNKEDLFHFLQPSNADHFYPIDILSERKKGICILFFFGNVMSFFLH
jgi:hypothetical protein